MSVLSVYTSGVSTTGIELINDAVSQAFGDCSVEELGRDNLRYKVRLGAKNTSVVLIILDTISMDECKDIENGLYSSSKFYNYVGDRQLVDFLNEIYGLSLEVDEAQYSLLQEGTDVVKGTIDDREELIETFNSQLQDKDNIIKTLNCHIKELKKIISDGGYAVDDGKLNQLEDENLSLKNKVSDLSKTLGDFEVSILEKDNRISELGTLNGNLKEKVSKLESDLLSCSDELARERVISSQKSGVIRDKERETADLREKLESFDSLMELKDSLKDKVADSEKEISNLKVIINNLNSDISVKDTNISRLEADLQAKGRVSEQVAEYKELLEEEQLFKTNLTKKLNTLQVDYSAISEKYDSLVQTLKTRESEITSLKDSLTETEKYLAKANNDKILLSEKIKVLEQSSDFGDSVNSTITELSELRKKYAELQLDVFNILSTKSLPNGSVKVPLIKGTLGRFKNVKFYFSGNTESRKGTYKSLFNELINTSDKVIIVDVTSETAIDYVFQMRSIVDGMSWFSTGGGVQRHLSPTCISNVKVLMPKLGYINDGYFLTVNWEKRLEELENSGYKVIVYCGDISNLVGRVLFETFSELGDTYIYVHGNALGSRSVVANSSGLKGIKSCSIVYYDFDKNVSKFFDIMSKKCECKITSYSRV